MTRRKKPTEREVVAIVARQLGIIEDQSVVGGAVPCIICGICKEPILCDFGAIERDHDDAIGFGEGRDTLANCRYVHGHCHKQKTAQDKARMAKADRQKGEKTGQRARRERRNERDEILEEQGKRARALWPKGRKMQSRPMERRKT